MTNHPEEEKSSWSQNTRKILRKKTMTANPIIVVFVPNFDESSMSSTWHVKWDDDGDDDDDDDDDDDGDDDDDDDVICAITKHL